MHIEQKGKIYKIFSMEMMVFPVLFGTPLRASRCFKIGTINVRNLYEKTWKNKKQKGSYYHSVSVRPRPCRVRPAGITSRARAFTSALRIFSKPEEWKREKRERRRRSRFALWLAIEREIARALSLVIVAAAVVVSVYARYQLQPQHVVVIVLLFKVSSLENQLHLR